MPSDSAFVTLLKRRHIHTDPLAQPGLAARQASVHGSPLDRNDRRSTWAVSTGVPSLDDGGNSRR
jgi:hypothetical protein